MTLTFRSLAATSDASAYPHTREKSPAESAGRYQLNTGDIGRSYWAKVTRDGVLLTSARGATVERAVAEAVRNVRLARHCGSL